MKYFLLLFGMSALSIEIATKESRPERYIICYFSLCILCIGLRRIPHMIEKYNIHTGSEKLTSEILSEDIRIHHDILIFLKLSKERSKYLLETRDICRTRKSMLYSRATRSYIDNRRSIYLDIWKDLGRYRSSEVGRECIYRLDRVFSESRDEV